MINTMTVYGFSNNAEASVLFNGDYCVNNLYLSGSGVRLYSPILRRFLSYDSFAPSAQAGINGYTLLNGDPIQYVDPTGHFSNAIGSLREDVVTLESFSKLSNKVDADPIKQIVGHVAEVAGIGVIVYGVYKNFHKPKLSIGSMAKYLTGGLFLFLWGAASVQAGKEQTITQDLENEKSFGIMKSIFLSIVFFVLPNVIGNKMASSQMKKNLGSEVDDRYLMDNILLGQNDNQGSRKNSISKLSSSSNNNTDDTNQSSGNNTVLPKGSQVGGMRVIVNDRNTARPVGDIIVAGGNIMQETHF